MSAKVRVLFFGAAQEIAGKADEELTAGDTASLRREIYDRYPAMRNISFRMALNRTFLREESDLRDNDLIAILP
ncbi:MAG: MoaD/ThiS family protein, partial [Bacteroidales bacterium]|nr:MoaD/ThiS family protein [Bacteroidales bacterium]